MNRSRWLLVGRIGLVGLALSAAALVVTRLRRAVSDAVARARDVPLSPLTAGWRVGADYPERRGITAEGEVAGEMDDLSAFAGPTFDPAAVAPAVREFYERTADYELAYDVRWHRPFRLGAALASPATSRVEQLNLPGPGDADTRELRSRFVRVDPAADPREGARAWVRTREDGEGGDAAVFVAIYAHHERESLGVRYVNIAVPLPGANLSTVLRPENVDEGGLELTTLRGEVVSDDPVPDGDEGLYLVTPWASFDLPLDQRFRVRPADERDDGELSVASPDGEPAVAATHEMWMFGRQFLTIRYGAWAGD